MKTIFKKIEDILSENKTAVIGIDGYCASGKTTLANNLAERFDFQIIHMDDFFLPFDMRTEERLAEAGGNVHYERFRSEVADGIKSGQDFEYRVFSCKEGCFTESKTVNCNKPIIIEGSYAFHPYISDIYDLKIFLKTNLESQLTRILNRNGKEALEAFKTKWIPLENKYFSTYNIEKKCDTIIET